MQPRRILYFSPRACWPLTTGARLRDYHLAHQLALRAELTYLGIGSTDPVPKDAGFKRVEAAPKPKPYTPGKLLTGWIGPHPVTVLNYTSATVRQTLAEVLQAGNFDSVQIEGVHLVRYIETIRKYLPHAAVVADWHNIESEIMRRYAETTVNPARRLFARRTAYLIERAENRLLEASDAHTVASGREKHSLNARNVATAPVFAIPNGVDVAHYLSTSAERVGERRDVLFVGSMDYHANIDGVSWFANHAWPLISNRCPQLRLVVAGRDPAPEIRALASGNVVITGTVPDIRPFYAQAVVVVVPLRVGSGTRLKILEAMAAGVPVVSTTLGAEGIDVTPGADIIIADEPEAMAGSVVELSRSERGREALIEAARRLVSERYEWSQLGSALWDIHCAAIERKRHPK